MRKLIVLVALAALTGCQGPGLFASRTKEKERSNHRPPDPLLSPDLDEQQKWGRSRFSYPEDDRGIAPPSYSGRGTPSGR